MATHAVTVTLYVQAESADQAERRVMDAIDRGIMDDGNVESADVLRVESMKYCVTDDADGPFIEDDQCQFCGEFESDCTCTLGSDQSCTVDEDEG